MQQNLFKNSKLLLHSKIQKNPIEKTSENNGDLIQNLATKKKSFIWTLLGPFIILTTIFFTNISFDIFYEILFRYLNQIEINLFPPLENLSFLIFFYFLALFGGILADFFIGKFWIIFWILLINILFQILLATSQILFSEFYPLHPYFEFLQIIILICFQGVLLPCWPSFGGDQFASNDFGKISCFFATYYFVGQFLRVFTNFGIPTIFDNLCLSTGQCSFLIYGVGIGLACFATVLILTTQSVLQKLPSLQNENVMGRTLWTIRKALSNKSDKVLKINRQQNLQPKHWLDNFLKDHDCALDKNCRVRQLTDPLSCEQVEFLILIKIIIRFIIILLPIPFIWAIFLKQPELWAEQAFNMNFVVFMEGIAIIPELMPIFNILLVLIFIPLFQFLIYPLLLKCGLWPSYLQRMCAGILIASIAFFISSFIQQTVESTIPDQIPPNQAFITLINNFENDCNVTIKINSISDPNTIFEKTLSHQSALIDDKLQNLTQLIRIPINNGKNDIELNADLQFNGICFGHKFVNHQFEAKGGHLNYLIVSPQGIFENSIKWSKPKAMGAKVSINMALSCSSFDTKLAINCSKLSDNIQKSLTPFSQNVILCQEVMLNNQTACNFKNINQNYFWDGSKDLSLISNLLAFPPHGDNMGIGSWSYYNPKNIQMGIYRLFLTSKSIEDPLIFESDLLEIDPEFRLILDGIGGIYMITLTLSNSPIFEGNQTIPENFIGKPITNLFQIIPSNYLPLYWQFLQYILMAIAEILFCITGMEFCYVEAPAPLRTFILSLWYLTIGVGLLIQKCMIYFMPVLTMPFILNIFSLVLLFFGIIFAMLAYYVFEYTNFGITLSSSTFISNISKNGPKNVNGSAVFEPNPRDIRTIAKIDTTIPPQMENPKLHGKKFITRL